MYQDDFPIERVARNLRSRFQIGFARHMMRMLPDLDDVAYQPSVEGLRILGRSEAALALPSDIVRQMHADDVAFDAPRVRLTYRGRVCEPVMGLRACVDEAHEALVVQDLRDRGCHVEDVDRKHGRSTVRARGRLRVLLGYPDAIVKLSDDTTELVMWLSHYAHAGQ